MGYPVPKTQEQNGANRNDIAKQHDEKFSRENMATVSGSVSEVKTNQPIAGASVDATGLTTAGATSGGDGKFTVAGGLELNTVVNLTASARGYKSQYKYFRILDRKPFVPFSLEARQGGATGEAMLIVHVVDKDTGNPIPNAIVRVERGFTTAREPPGPTSSEGIFTLSKLSQDDVVTVSAEAKGYSSATRPVKLAHDETGVTIALSAEISSMTVSSNPKDPGPRESLTVSVQIVPRRAGVTLRVTVKGTDGYHNSQVLITDDSGRVSLFVPGGEKTITDTVEAQLLGAKLLNGKDKPDDPLIYVF